MPAVQVRARPGWRAVRTVLFTLVALVVVVAVLVAPTELEELHPSAFARLPVELLAFLAVVLALPPSMVRTRRVLALVAGLLLGVTAVFKLLDIGLMEALNRPFDPLIDWQYAAALVETVRSSVGDGLGLALVAAGIVVSLGLLALVPLALLRLAGAAVSHRRPAATAVVALGLVWAGLAVAGVRSGGDPMASSDTARYVSGQVTRIPGQLRDLAEFEAAAGDDPYGDASGDELFAGLRGKDVLIVFVESYGRVALEDPELFPGVLDALDRGEEQLTAAGFSSRSAWLTSPTFGAVSWLAHATLQSGLWVDSQQRYDAIVTSPRLTLSRLFGRAGWRTVASVPANTRDWPQGVWYGYDHVYDSRNMGYRGPRFGYPPMPDQYTLDAFHRLELAPRQRRPVMAEIDLITSHAPWSRTPRMIDQAAVGDGSVFEGMPEQLPSETDIWPDRDRVRSAYATSIAYSLTAVSTFLATYGDDDLVVVLLGDHQPATIVSGSDAGHDVPVTLLARDPAVLDGIDGWGWAAGLRPGSEAPTWRMDSFRDRFLQAYATRDTGTTADRDR